LGGAFSKLGCHGSPPRFGDDEFGVGEGFADGFHVGASKGPSFLDWLPFPDGIDVHGEEVEMLCERFSKAGPPIVVVGHRDRLFDGTLHLFDIADDRLDRHHVIVPFDEGFVSNSDGGDTVGILIRELDETIDFLGIFDLFCREFLRCEELWLPRVFWDC
jgi:hypothetical protein